MTSKDIGFVGLGIMGRPMAKNLIKAGYSLTVFDVIGTNVEQVVTEGASAASSAKEVAANTSVIITMVPDSADSEAAIMGPNGVLEGASKGSVVIDMSSIAPGVSQRIADACESAGVEFLDAPVSGGEPKAIDGTLAIMVGGKKEVFDGHVDLLNSLGASVVLCGNYGAGNITKLANQIIVAANIEAVSEALVLSSKAGLDPNVVFQAIRGGLAGSTVLDAKAPMMIEGNFKAGFRIKLHQKDLHNALLTGKELGVPLPVTGLVQQMIGSLMNDGKGDLDHSAIANFIEDMANTTISQE
ncbi:MAG: 2-hydroxy-3-oxopropionate reductase [Chloroflexota bacterium]|jgi:2-hydroxy-3-oxopropionate reductase|nr:2-hydroxy-3-oxopropionate reductase [Chloroflexota bacterium]